MHLLSKSLQSFSFQPKDVISQTGLVSFGWNNGWIGFLSVKYRVIIIIFFYHNPSGMNAKLLSHHQHCESVYADEVGMGSRGERRIAKVITNIIPLQAAVMAVNAQLERGADQPRAV
ncbi:hypothetical protein CHARACLAT_018627 [Characodon lateralis]|uniref:Uncharacterized protein n=1 Tax=Characodon lateralis TaxID=208331 RepID=A0ABU7DJY9_9TELE|nr:hypothetical protein [Characodon lateralis]